MTASTSFTIRHNIEVAHRLTLLPGKCQRIHGHSMWVELTMTGDVDPAGLISGLDFGAAKRAFRAYLDTFYDHSLLLNARDPLVPLDLPGMMTMAGDPTVENIAERIGRHCVGEFHQLRGHTVTVHETGTNSVTWTAA